MFAAAKESCPQPAAGLADAVRCRFRPIFRETNAFETRTLRGMLELVSLTGNIITDEQSEYYHHTHAVFSYVAMTHAKKKVLISAYGVVSDLLS